MRTFAAAAVDMACPAAFVAETLPVPSLVHIQQSSARAAAVAVAAAADTQPHLGLVQRQTLAAAVEQVGHYSCDDVLVAWADSVALSVVVVPSSAVVAFVALASELLPGSLDLLLSSSSSSVAAEL